MNTLQLPSPRALPRAARITLLAFVSCLLMTGTATGNEYQAPRTSHGHPDLQGIWDFRTLTPLERPKALGDKAVFTKEEAEAFRQQAVARTDVDNQSDIPAAFDVEAAYNNFWWDFGTEINEDRRTSLIMDPADGRIPALTPQALEAMEESRRRIPPVREIGSLGMGTFRPAGPEYLGLSERCLVGFNAGPPLMPSAYNNNLRIFQTPDHVALVTEMVHTFRIVPLDDSPHLPAEMTEWSGDARGHWDGETLVITTTNFTDKLPAFQMPFSIDDPTMSGAVGTGKFLKLVEKFTRISDTRIAYEYTVIDPQTFTRPFTAVIPLRATDNQMFEYACHEGNYAMAGMLKGARQMEKEEMAAR